MAKRGRPKKPRVKIIDLVKYLDSLPAGNITKQSLTGDKMIIVRRYTEELIYLESVMLALKEDIHMQGEIENFVQGSQQLRRANPSLELYFSTLRAYRSLINKINELVSGVVVW